MLLIDELLVGRAAGAPLANKGVSSLNWMDIMFSRK